MNVEKFKNVLKRFAEHLRDFGEVKAAEAVETILKALDRGVFDEAQAKSDDLDVIVEALKQLPPGQLKKVLSDEIIAILGKYGVVIE